MQTNIASPRFGYNDEYFKTMQARQADIKRNQAMVDFAAQRKNAEDVVAFASAKTTHQANRLDVKG